jgi:c-di-GMP-binding flagellar brake protein YcgR
MLEVRSLMNPSADHMVEARLRDLSLGGCSLVTDKRLPERSEFGIELQAGEETATISGRLVYSLQVGRNRVQWRQGLSFLDMSYSDAQLVRELVMRLQREELGRRMEYRPEDKVGE